MNIAVFCSFKDIDEKYAKPAEEFVERFAKAGHHLVFGGSNVGLMKRVADIAQRNGARVTSITFEKLRQSVRQESDEILVAKDLPERKSLFMKHADAFVVLPGGIGTLDEITEMMELKKHQLHDKRIVIFNIAGYYDGLRTLMERMESEGFLAHSLSYYVAFADAVEDVLAALAS
ncbi:MAG: TIGR00730 family Rossman fold protein [Patescibacteria group bacterium]|nr:TIGR00730 family Rossman fold protein [Patescibacteria group bacterium]MDE1966083.1 TIGR00730 family Rossman fold protein [Patescibacteria group bacterium]